MSQLGRRFSNAVVASLVLVLAACSSESDEETVSVRPVRTTTVEEHRPTREVRLAGTVESQVQINLAFKIGGRVIERLVSVGDSVEADQVVARLDASDEENNLRAAEASLNAADGQLSEARLNYDRQRHLFDRQVVARAALDRAEQALNTARAAADAAQASVGIAQHRLDNTQLRADAPGVVTAVAAEPGEIVAAGRMVVQLARDDGKDAVFNVPPAVLSGSPPDPKVVVALSLAPATSAEGRVREVSPRADPVTGTFLVRVGLINPPSDMRLGSAVTGTATFGGVTGIQIPASALTSNSGQPAVWVVDPASSKVSLRTVEIADFSPSSVVVASGLSVGEVVVTAGVQALRPGQEVRLLGEQS